MGEIAEDFLDGSCCSLCGVYFKHPKGGIYVHEYPVVCEGCYKDLTKSEKKIHQKCDDGIKTF